MNQFNMSPIMPVQARFVASDQEAAMVPNPTIGCLFCFNQNIMEVYVKYADGRPMETYELNKKEPPAPPKYITEDDVSKMLDEKFSELKEMISKQNNKEWKKKERVYNG